MVRKNAKVMRSEKVSEAQHRATLNWRSKNPDKVHEYYRINNERKKMKMLELENKLAEAEREKNELAERLNQSLRINPE